MWATAGVVESPSAGDVIADTGPISVGLNFALTALIWSQQNTSFTIHQRNALNTADINSQKVSPISGFIYVAMPVTLLTNQRITVTVDESLELNCQASLLF